mgnify:FL=1
MILNGICVREKVLEELKSNLNSLKASLCLAIIQVSKDSASSLYIKEKIDLAETLGYKYKYYYLEDNVSNEEVINKIDKLNNDSTITGIILELPLPEHLDKELICSRISPLKDVDCLNNSATSFSYKYNCLKPATVLAILDLITYYNIDISSSNIVIIGRSSHIGIPLVNYLIEKNATVTICHSYTKNLSKITNMADVIITAVGIKHFLTKDMVSDSSIIIDVGITREGNKTYGDADFDNLKDKVDAITPSVGGVGAITTVEVLNNVYKAYLIRNTKTKV